MKRSLTRVAPVAFVVLSLSAALAVAEEEKYPDAQRFGAGRRTANRARHVHRGPRPIDSGGRRSGASRRSHRSVARHVQRERDGRLRRHRTGWHRAKRRAAGARRQRHDERRRAGLGQQLRRSAASRFATTRATAWWSTRPRTPRSRTWSATTRASTASIRCCARACWSRAASFPTCGTRASMPDSARTWSFGTARRYRNTIGIETENCINVVMANNSAHDNSLGLLVVLLPDLPTTVASNARVINNRVLNNNYPNLSPPGNMVSLVEPGNGIVDQRGRQHRGDQERSARPRVVRHRDVRVDRRVSAGSQAERRAEPRSQLHPRQHAFATTAARSSKRLAIAGRHRRRLVLERQGRGQRLERSHGQDLPREVARLGRRASSRRRRLISGAALFEASLARRIHYGVRRNNRRRTPYFLDGIGRSGISPQNGIVCRISIRRCNKVG